MTAFEIAQLAIVLAPIAQTLTIEGKQIIATYKENLTQEQIDKALDLSKSANWPKLTFGAEA
jgi:hypothetical protein